MILHWIIQSIQSHTLYTYLHKSYVVIRKFPSNEWKPGLRCELWQRINLNKELCNEILLSKYRQPTKTKILHAHTHTHSKNTICFSSFFICVWTNTQNLFANDAHREWCCALLFFTQTRYFDFNVEWDLVFSHI